MNDIIVDSSVFAKWVLPEHDSPLARRVVSDAVASGQQLIVLEIAIAEWETPLRGLLAGVGMVENWFSPLRFLRSGQFSFLALLLLRNGGPFAIMEHGYSGALSGG